MSSLKLMLGMIPATSKLEKVENALVAEYEKLIAYAGSNELARYYDLYEKVNSSSFRQKRKEIESLTFKGSEEYSREQEFFKLKKTKELTLFFRTLSGSELKKYDSIASSQTLSDYLELEKFISSSAFKEKQKMKPITFKDSEEYAKFIQYKKLRSDRDVRKKRDEAKVRLFEELSTFVSSPEFLRKKEMKPVKFKDTPEYQKYLEYQKLKDSDDIKFYFKFKSSRELSNYLKVKDSSVLKRYHELDAYLKSGEFATRKEYLLDKRRFEKSDMYKELLEYNALKDSDNINWYFSVKDSNKFDVLKKREKTFGDEFEGDAPDLDKWLTNYYWGEKLLHDRYSIDTDLHAYTAGENFEMKNSLLRIITKPQKINGKAWNPERGFNLKEFSFSSGLINTGVSFRQKYGIFEAKIRLNNEDVRNAFWLTGEKMTPHINICRTGRNKVWVDHFLSKESVKKSSIGSRYLSDFYIYRLEWTPESLVWKINGVEIMKQTAGIPNEPMYISIAGGVDKPVSGSSSMEIDWVRVYQFKN